MKQVLVILFSVFCFVGVGTAWAVSSTQASPFSGIDATGNTDVTTPLNAALAALPNGSAVSFPVNGRYRIEGTLIVEGKTGITIDGNGSTFFATTNGSAVPGPQCGPNATSAACRYPNRGRYHWNLRNDTNVTLKNINVVGSAPHAGADWPGNIALEAQHGFNVGDNNHGIVLDHNTVTNVWGDNVYVAGGSKDVLIENGTFAHSARMGFSVTNADHVTFTHNLLDDARLAAIDLEPNGPNNTITNVVISQNRIGWSNHCTIDNYGNGNADVHDITIDGNQTFNTPLRVCTQGAASHHRYNYTVTNNVGSQRASGPPNEPTLGFWYIDHVTITNNTQAFATRGWGTHFPAASFDKCGVSVQVSGNHFSLPTGFADFAPRACP